VAGVRHLGSKVGFSSIGPQVAIAAPAGNCVNTSGACLYPILTTINKGTTTPSTNGYSDSFDYSVGTSFSTPIVAGAVALMLSADPTLTPAAIRSALQRTARPFVTSGSGAEVAACKAPSSTEQLECYCTTSTCGAGMLDAGAAVAAVVPTSAPPTAVIALSNGTPTAGDAITLNAGASSASGGRTVAGYQWTITGGAGLASFSGATNASTATLLTNAAGTVTVTLLVTDSTGATGTSSSVVAVQAAASTTPSTPSTAGGGSSGGGAMSWGWLAGLGLAVLALRRRGAA
jgi:serine protease